MQGVPCHRSIFKTKGAILVPTTPPPPSGLG